MRLRAYPTSPTLARKRELLRALCAGASCWLALSARAEPALRVRALSGIEASVTRTADATHVRGVLHDDQGAAIGGAEVRLRMEPQAADANVQAQSVPTSPSGDFDATFALPFAPYRLRATYDGDTLYEQCETVQPVDLTRAEVQLRIELEAGRALQLDTEATRIEVQATSLDGGSHLHVTLQDELGRALARGETDQDGVWRVDVSSQFLGAPGAGRLVATSAADATRMSARSELAVIRRLQTKLTLQASLRTGPTRVLVSGSLRDARGPLNHQAIGIFVDAGHALTLLTDAQGTFRQELALRSGEDGDARSHYLQARFEPDAPWHGASRSKTIALRAQPAARPSGLWLLLPALISVALVLRAGRHAQVPRDEATLQRSVPADASQSSRVPSARRHSIRGSVADSETREPLPGAQIEIQDADQRVVPASVSALGTFQSDELAAGHYHVTASASGYAAATSEVRVPHAGDGSALQIRLSSLRALAFHAYRPVAVQIVPNPRQRLTSTLRDVLARAQQQAPAPEALVALTCLVEEASYGPATPTAASLETIHRAARATLAALDDTHAQAKPNPEE